jgi:SAM-dependent methyltransferase
MAYRMLWSPSLKPMLGSLPLVRRLYDGWSRHHPIDAEYGIDTSGVIPADQCAPEASMAARMSPYAGSQPSIVRASLASLPDHAAYAFADLGCGKGRPLVLASEFPFRAIVGIEISKALVEIARRNARAVATRYPERTPIEVRAGDATLAPALGGRVVYYMYHPFDRSLVLALIENIERLLGSALDHAFFVYYNPVHGDVLDRSSRFIRWRADVHPYAVSELGYGPDIADTVVIWQTTPARYNAQPGADRRIAVAPSGSSASLRA